jgi:hypothetical protein
MEVWGSGCLGSLTLPSWASGVGGQRGLVISSVSSPLWDGLGRVEGGRMGSAWWREIARTRDGVGGLRDGWLERV